MTTPPGVTRTRSFATMLEAITRALEQLARLFGAGLKIGYAVSLFLGFWVLRGYCMSAGIPMPVPDASLLCYLAVLAAACCFVMLWLAGMPLWFFVVVATTPEFRALRPCGATWPPSKQDVFRFTKRWTLVFLPFLFSSSLACLAWVLGIWFSPTWLGTNAVVFWGHSFLAVVSGAGVVLLLLAMVISISVYRWRSERFFSGNARTPLDVRAFAGASLSAMLLAGVWMFSATVSVLVLILGTPILPVDASVLNLLWIYGGLVLWLAVAFFLLLWERYKAAFAFGVAVVSVGMFLCAPRLGGITLRALGYGGGLPISVVARLAEPGSLTVLPGRIDGCLLLATGSQLSILHPVDKRLKLAKCHFRPLTPHLVDGHQVATRVDTIPREDVLDILFVGKRS